MNVRGSEQEDLAAFAVLGTWERIGNEVPIRSEFSSSLFDWILLQLQFYIPFIYPLGLKLCSEPWTIRMDPDKPLAPPACPPLPGDTKPLRCQRLKAFIFHLMLFLLYHVSKDGKSLLDRTMPKPNSGVKDFILL